MEVDEGGESDELEGGEDGGGGVDCFGVFPGCESCFFPFSFCMP